MEKRGEDIVLSEMHDAQEVTLRGDNRLVVELKSNPSTGYRWDIVRLDRGVLRVLSEKWNPDSELLGTSGRQVFRLAGVKPGRSQLTFFYARPWEKERPPLQTVSFSVEVVAPGPVGEEEHFTSEDDAEELAQEEDPWLPSATAGLLGLPSKFNWCDQGVCPPVRDQGQCGSCWAFGTVAPFETLIKLKNNQSKDISEQYLVSCNIDDWGCDGGWWAHDYHINKIPPGETKAGAVYEAEFPYQAKEVACNPPHNHYEKLSSWAYVGSSSGVPSTDSIKNAIYNYGPVAAAVCVNSSFQKYSGGVYNPRFSCRQINHGIVLVGWDDSQGVWILRNSWGPNWGEQGYMRIKYGKNSVGYGANYVVFP